MTHDDKESVCELPETNMLTTNDVWRRRMTHDDNEWRKMTTNDAQWQRMTYDNDWRIRRANEAWRLQIATTNEANECQKRMEKQSTTRNEREGRQRANDDQPQTTKQWGVTTTNDEKEYRQMTHDGNEWRGMVNWRMTTTNDRWQQRMKYNVN